VIVTIEANGAVGQGMALLDSGADATIVPAEALIGAGIDYASLPVAGLNRGAGGNFEARIAPARVKFREWVICDQVLVAPAGALPAPLLGRMDFFKLFVVKFSWHRIPPTVDIDPVAVPGGRKR
jgi:Aspartyl protease